MPLCNHCRAEADWEDKPEGFEERAKAEPNAVPGADVCDRCGFSDGEFEEADHWSDAARDQGRVRPPRPPASAADTGSSFGVEEAMSVGWATAALVLVAVTGATAAGRLPDRYALAAMAVVMLPLVAMNTAVYAARRAGR